MHFDISATGQHDFMLSHEKRDIIEVGDTIGLFTHLSHEVQIIGYDTKAIFVGNVQISLITVVNLILLKVSTRNCQQLIITIVKGPFY